MKTHIEGSIRHTLPTPPSGSLPDYAWLDRPHGYASAFSALTQSLETYRQRLWRAQQPGTFSRLSLAKREMGCCAARIQEIIFVISLYEGTPDGDAILRSPGVRGARAAIADSTKIPSTREEAIAALVESDVARWGEAERAASKRHHQGRTYGLALNELANRAELAGHPDDALRAAARAALTSGDKSALRRGG